MVHLFNLRLPTPRNTISSISISSREGEANMVGKGVGVDLDMMVQR